LATDDDLDAIERIERVSNASPWSRDSFLVEMQREVSIVEVLTESSTVVGFVVHWLVAGEGHILNVAVAPEARGRGFGRALVRHVLKSARAADGTYVMLEVREGNVAARGLYEGMGFKRIAERGDYYRDNSETALVLGLVLE
jgi:ribosomal-protein-alanine N-acetyltransferase